MRVVLPALARARGLASAGGRQRATATTDIKVDQVGACGDRDCADEILWAAAELWRTTKDGACER